MAPSQVAFYMGSVVLWLGAAALWYGSKKTSHKALEKDVNFLKEELRRISTPPPRLYDPISHRVEEIVTEGWRSEEIPIMEDDLLDDDEPTNPMIRLPATDRLPKVIVTV
jgi:hypothetical protein